MPSRHNTPCHRHDNRAVANTTRYPEGGTSRALTGPEGTRRLTEGAGRAGAKEKTTAKTKGQQKPATPQAKTKQKTKGPRDTGHKGTTRAGRSKQAAHCRPQHTTQRKTTNKEQTKKARGQTVKRQTGDQTKRDNEHKRIKEYECTCPVCTSTRRVKINLWGGRTETKVIIYQSSLRVCTQASTQSKRDQDLSATVPW